MKMVITAVGGSSSRRAAAESRERSVQDLCSPTVTRPHSGSILINAFLVRALAGGKALLVCIAEWQRRSAGRWELMTLTNRDLHDIGIGRSEATAEAKKPFWDA